MKVAKPESHGFDGARLARLDAFVKERYLDTGKLPNAQILVARGGDVVHFSHQGAAREGGAPLDETSLFRIASMTKPVTSLAFMMLVEEGKVALDTPVHHVLPELEGVGVHAGGGGDLPFEARPSARPMQMVDLLRHTSGLTYSFQERTPIDAAYRAGNIEAWHGNLTLDEFAAALGRLPLEFSPGDEWNYSVSTDVLGLVVERLSGRSLDVFLDERIFQPLHMDDTFFTVPGDKIDRLTDCWALRPGAGVVMYDRGAESFWSRRPRMLSGGGGLVSTAVDYHRFCRMLLDGGEHGLTRIAGRKTIELMTMNHLPGGSDLATMSRSLFSETANAGVGFGLGFAVTTDVAKTLIPGSVGDYGWGGMFSTFFFCNPVERVHMVFMTQFSPSLLYPIRRELKTLVYAALT